MIPPNRSAVLLAMGQRVRAWVLLAVIAGVLAGCGGAGAPSTNPGGGGEASPTPRYDY